MTEEETLATSATLNAIGDVLDQLIQRVYGQRIDFVLVMMPTAKVLDFQAISSVSPDELHERLMRFQAVYLQKEAHRGGQETTH